MTRSSLRLTTAISVSLSLMQPHAALSQMLSEELRRLVTSPDLCMTDPADAECDALRAAVDLCADDPSAAICPELDGLTPEDLSVVAEPAQPTPETAPAAEDGAPPAPEVAAPVDPEVGPDVTSEQPEPESLPDVAPTEAPVTEATPSEGTQAEETPTDSPPEVAPSEPETTAPDIAETQDDAPTAEQDAEAAPAPEATADVPADVPTPEMQADVPTADQSPSTGAAPVAETEAEQDPPAVIAVEDVPAPVVAPPEPAPMPTEAEAAVIEEMLEEPEVSAAVETLSQTLSVQNEALTADPDDTAADDTEAASDAPVTALSAAAAAMTAILSPDTAPESAPPAADVTEQVLTTETTRSSDEDFNSALSTQTPTESRGGLRGLGDLEKAGLAALGALAVGMIVANNRVVAQSDDRVVVDRGNGDLEIWKDDNAILRRPGVVERSQRFDDGSTLTTLEQDDGSRVVTIRDATGRVLRRERVLADGRVVQLFDDTRQFAPVSVSTLPQPRVSEIRITERTDTAMLRALLDEAEQTDLDRRFSLRQVREIHELRTLAPELTAEAITFESGSSALRPTEAARLLRLGRIIQEMIAENPAEIFLIKGHTDATGGAALNLALSDRRAESVALGLVEYLGLPPENLVVQGYGKRFLKIPTLDSEPLNRRVAVRRITSLIQ